MINLLPPQVKENIVYARRNTRMLHLAIAGLFIIAGMLGIILFGHMYLNKSIASYQTAGDRLQTELKVQNVDATEKQLQTISSDIKLIVQVLSKEVLFSKLLTQVGAVMPPQSVLSNIEISKLDGGLDLTASAVDYKTATQVQVNLQDPSNKIFDKVDIVSVTCGTVVKDQYPCSVSLRARFAKNNPYLFINSTPAGAKS